jgi:uncharacterized RmlC-like cupin family protein/pimeloyl-ACP methyl ester carboxylesterase
VASFCLLHGAWHEPSCWEPLAQRLRERGHQVLAPDLPLHDGEAGWRARVAPALAALEGVTGPVVVVGHSLASGYAAVVADTRAGSLLVHLCPRLGPFAAPPGAPPRFRAGFPFPPERTNGTSAWDPDAAIAAMYRRLPADTARALARRLRPLAPPSDEYPLPAHPYVPTVLIYASDDEIFEPAWERFMASRLLGLEPIEIPGGHFPMLESPDALADLLDDLARDFPPDWRRRGVRVVHADELDLNTPQTPGMLRAAAITTARAGAEKLWAGTVVIHPDAKTGAHHHGPVESVIYVVSGRARMRWGERLEFIAEAAPGDFIYVPPFAPHQEINASPDEPLSCVLVRTGQEPVVVNLDLPEVEPNPREVHWVDDLHPPP